MMRSLSADKNVYMHLAKHEYLTELDHFGDIHVYKD